MASFDQELREVWDLAKPERIEPHLGEQPLPRVSQLPGERLQRRIFWDAIVKLLVPLALLAAGPQLVGRGSAFLLFWGLLLAGTLALGLWQLSWVRSWARASRGDALLNCLQGNVRLWERRRWPLALLLGATPALVWQIHQCLYYLLEKGGFHISGIVAGLMLFLGGAVLWLFSTWVFLARVDRWLLQMRLALRTFDDSEDIQNIEAARSLARWRTWALLLALLVLLVAGILVMVWGARS